jgi:hypothetical protein
MSAISTTRAAAAAEAGGLVEVAHNPYPEKLQLVAISVLDSRRRDTFRFRACYYPFQGATGLGEELVGCIKLDGRNVSVRAAGLYPGEGICLRAFHPIIGVFQEKVFYCTHEEAEDRWELLRRAFPHIEADPLTPHTNIRSDRIARLWRTFRPEAYRTSQAELIACRKRLLEQLAAEWGQSKIFAKVYVPSWQELIDLGYSFNGIAWCDHILAVYHAAPSVPCDPLNIPLLKVSGGTIIHARRRALSEARGKAEFDRSHRSWPRQFADFAIETIWPPAPPTAPPLVAGPAAEEQQPLLAAPPVAAAIAEEKEPELAAARAAGGGPVIELIQDEPAAPAAPPQAVDASRPPERGPRDEGRAPRAVPAAPQRPFFFRVFAAIWSAFCALFGRWWGRGAWG